jgi:hypothetical protein
LRQYGALMDALGVKETPDHEDARRVLNKLAADVGHRRLTPEQIDLALACWRVVERDRDEGKVDEAWLEGLHDQPSVPSAATVLERPDWLYFEDRPGLSAKFGPILVSSIIDRPPGAWRAMKVAGIRDLGRVVRLHVVEKTDPRPGIEAEERIRERRDLLERVIEVHTRAAGDVNRGVLDSLNAFEVAELVIQYSVALDGGSREIESIPKAESAAYVEAEGNLYYVAEAAIPWSAIARELAIGLFPTLEPGGPASGFRDVLNSASHEAAAAVLDELLYPRLVASNGAASTEEPLESLGSEEPAATETQQGVGAKPEENEPKRQDPDTNPEPSEADGVHEPTSGTGNAAGHSESDAGAGTGIGGAASAPAGKHTKQQRQSRLRTYVIREGAPGSGDGLETDEAQAERRTAIEEAGVHRVVEAEQRAGWVPEVMPPGNPGFDIRSLSPIGDVRLIEVKATAVEWGEQGVAVSHRQFLTSLDEEDRFWLYVVERADDDDNYRVYRIFNPGGRVDQFIFDGGWRGADAGPETAVEVLASGTAGPDEETPG